MQDPRVVPRLMDRHAIFLLDHEHAPPRAPLREAIRRCETDDAAPNDDQIERHAEPREGECRTVRRIDRPYECKSG